MSTNDVNERGGKQKVVLETIHWLLLRKSMKDPKKRVKADLKAAIKVARNLLRERLGQPSFNLRQEFVITSLSRDARFVLPPTRGKGYDDVFLAKPLELMSAEHVSVMGESVSYVKLLEIVFQIEDKQFSAEIKQQIKELLAA